MSLALKCPAFGESGIATRGTPASTFDAAAQEPLQRSSGWIVFSGAAQVKRGDRVRGIDERILRGWCLLDS